MDATSTTTCDLPDTTTLAAGLRSLDGPGAAALSQCTVVDREQNIYTSTFPAEIVTCRLIDGSALRLLCKYSGGLDFTTYGHRGGVSYEADVYRWFLDPRGVQAPRFFGTYREAGRGWTWLVLEFLEGSERMRFFENGMPLSARWLAQFHRTGEATLAETQVPFLNIYDRSYFNAWLRLARQHCSDACETHPWLANVFDRSMDILECLMDGPQCIIHGEFYPKNILIQEDRPYAVDWESAAVAAPEIDLASLTEGWPEDQARCGDELYVRERWPQGTPHCFTERLTAARLYFCLRWLGDQSQDPTPYLSGLYRIAQKSGMI
jgi:hypothetical protein